MYIPKAFEESRSAELVRVIESFSLGSLSYCVNGRIDAIHVPFEYSASPTGGVLRAHVARANPIWTALESGAEVLVIFRGEDAYVSPNWYPSKHELHRQVPTWNYQVVHVRGKIRKIDSVQALRGILERQTAVLEARAGEDKPWKLTDSADDYIEQLMACVMAIQIDISLITGKSKLGQDEVTRDREGAAHALGERNASEISNAMLTAPIRKEP